MNSNEEISLLDNENKVLLKNIISNVYIHLDVDNLCADSIRVALLENACGLRSQIPLTILVVRSLYQSEGENTFAKVQTIHENLNPAKDKSALKDNQVSAVLFMVSAVLIIKLQIARTLNGSS